MKHLIAIVFLLLLAVPASAACLSQGEAQQAVASGKARSLGSLKGAAGGEILSAQLCVEGGRYVYRIQVLANGKVTNKTLNASR
ncbi:PepSY domain-containing protein [Maricaulis maris]|uniref:PepSY domain-containing protein n=1 Tax=Maricaulis maris TaxID=74318 RepID=UPI003A8E3BA5